MKKQLLLILLLLGILAQFAVPAWLLCQRELTLRHGTVYLLNTMPVDPMDPFRGRYMVLEFKDFRTLAISTNESTRLRERSGQRVWLTLNTNQQGVASIKALHQQYPAEPCIQARIGWVLEKWEPTDPPQTNAVGGVVSNFRATVHLNSLPCKRYYLPEKLAPVAEKAYARYMRQGQATHAKVRVWRGHVFLEDLLLDGKPLREVLATMPDLDE